MKIYQITKEAAPAPVKVPPIPKLPDISGLTAQAPLEPNPGEKVSLKADGTIEYSGGFGTFIYDKTGKALKYSTPNFNGFGQTVDLTTQASTQSYNQGPLSVQQTKDAGGKVTGSDTSYNLGPAEIRRQVDATGNATNSATVPIGDETHVVQDQPASEDLNRMLKIAGLR